MNTSGQTQALHALTATEVVRAIDRGQTACEAVAPACLEHIAVCEPAGVGAAPLLLHIPLPSLMHLKTNNNSVEEALPWMPF